MKLRLFLLAVVLPQLALLFGSVAASAQAIVDVENTYSNVGAIMVWRVDDSGKPVQLTGFRKRHLDSPSRVRHGRSLHRCHQSTR